MKRSRTRMLLLLSILLLVFFVLALYLAYFELVKAPALAKHPANPRNWVDESHFARGLFLDRTGRPLMAREEADKGGRSGRYCLYPKEYAHVIGYHSRTYGQSGLEKSCQASLLNLPDDNFLSELRGKVLHPGVGNDVRLSIDHELQHFATKALEGHRGAFVALNPKTGEVYAMVSAPSFDLNRVDRNWANLLEAEGDVLVNRAVQGRYTPGSVLKAISSFALLDGRAAGQMKDDGVVRIDGYEFQNYGKKAFGPIGLKEALIHSSNVYFASQAQLAGPEVFRTCFTQFLFNQKIPFDLAVTPSKAVFSEGMERTLLASNAFGQGKVTTSPLHLALCYGAIANHGIMMAPHLVGSIQSPKGEVLRETAPRKIAQVSRSWADQVAEDLKETARENGGQDQSIVSLAAKTGTAQLGDGRTHSVYCAFAPTEDPTFAMALVLEGDGRSGRAGAQPLAIAIMNDWFLHHSNR